MKPPNSAPRTSRGTCPAPIVSIAIPSSPMRLTAIDPSTRSRKPVRTVLNTAATRLSPDPRKPALEARNLRIYPRRDRREARPDVFVARIARQDVLVNVACLFDEALADVEICHRQG